MNQGEPEDYNEEDEPETSDEVKCCPECEKPNQFGELCEGCRSDMAAEQAGKGGGDA